MKWIVLKCVLFLFLFSYCKKKKDEELPVITIELPQIGNKYGDNDMVEYKFAVTDNVKVKTVKVNLVNIDKQPVSSTNTTFYEQKSINVYDYLTIDADKINASGTYYLNVKASDGVNEQSVYVPIYISETILHRKSIFVISSEAAKGAEVQRIDSLDRLSVFMRLTGDFLTAVVSSKWKQLYTCGNYEGPLQAIKTVDGSRVWKEDNAMIGSKYFSAMHSNNTYVYVAYYDGIIKGFNQKGQQVFYKKKNNESLYYAEKIYRNDNHIVAFERHRTENTKKIISYFLNGSGNQELFTEIEAIDFYRKDAQSCYVIGNKNNVATILVYNIENNSVYNPTLISGKITCSTLAIDQIVYCDGKGILTYNTSTNTVGILKDNFSVEKMLYDVTTNELIVLKNAAVLFLDFQTGQIKKSIAVNSNASEIVLQLSK